eukprot:gb/GECH01013571.1/.p1 GENE.gb/GECH01013571.1/~~gb/GECH01013571.1/.p1  ORF type:complete len:327 (+),score=74.31 gb/GECH01013571.1/:1-981(+)
MLRSSSIHDHRPYRSSTHHLVHRRFNTINSNRVPHPSSSSSYWSRLLPVLQPRRSASTTSATNKKAVSDQEHLKEAIQSAERHRVVAALMKDRRYHLSIDEYVETAQQAVGPHRLSRDQALELLKHLHAAGVVLRCRVPSSSSLADQVFLHPDRVLELFMATDVAADTHVHRVQHHMEDLRQARSELQALEDRRDQLEREASRRANRFVWAGFAFLTVQVAVVARLTWWDYSWDTMEPVTYFLGFGFSIVAYLWYLLRNEEYSFDAMRNWRRERNLDRIMRKEGFSMDQLNAARDKVQRIESEIRKQVPGSLARLLLNDEQQIVMS